MTGPSHSLRALRPAPPHRTKDHAPVSILNDLPAGRPGRAASPQPRPLPQGTPGRRAVRGAHPGSGAEPGPVGRVRWKPAAPRVAGRPAGFPGRACQVLCRARWCTSTPANEPVRTGLPPRRQGLVDPPRRGRRARRPGHRASPLPRGRDGLIGLNRFIDPSNLSHQICPTRCHGGCWPPGCD